MFDVRSVASNILAVGFLFVFFSSRRRHTRCLSDWSSDVCSSDLTHGLYAHETASYTVQTGRIAGGHDVYPSVGAVVSLFKGYNAGYKGLIPTYIVLTEPQGRFSEEGFLGSRYKPFSTGGDPAPARFVVEGVVAQNLTDDRQKERREYLH